MSAPCIHALARPVYQAFLRIVSQVLFFVLIVFISLFVGLINTAFAAPYGPGETLNPSCSPGAANCTVLQLSVATSTNTYGIGTSTPYAAFSVVGEGVFRNLTATSTIATSTFAGGLLVGGGAFTYDFSSGITSIDDLQVGPMTFDTNAGVISWIDMPITSTATVDTKESYSARIDGTSILTVYAESNGSGGIQNTAIGIGTTSPFAKLSVMGNTFIAGTMTASIISATSTTATSTFANGISVTGGCIEFAGGCLALGGAGTPGGSSSNVQFNNGGGAFGGDSNFIWNNTTKRLGIGTSTPGQKLSVAGDILGNNIIGSYFTATSTISASTFPYASSTALTATSLFTTTLTDSVLTITGGAITAATGVTSSGTITFSGLAGVSGGEGAVCISAGVLYDASPGTDCTSSSRRFKHDIESLTNTNGLSLVNALRPVSFKFNNDNSEHLGFIAEEIAALEPRLAVFEVGSTTPKGVRYAEITAVLAKAIQEQQAQIDSVRSSVGSVLSSSFSSFVDSFTATVAQIRELTVQTLRIGDKVCVDDVCLGKEEFKTLLRNAGGVTTASVGGASTGSTSSSTTTTSVADTEPPVITIVGNNPAQLVLGATYLDLGVTVTDNRDTNLGAHVSGDQISTISAGEHTVTYVATDQAGNTSTSTRQVIVGGTTETGVIPDAATTTSSQ